MAIKKNIVINGRFFGRRMTGVDRFAFELISSINKLVASDCSIVQSLNFKIMLPPNVKVEQSFSNIAFETVGYNHGQLWEQWDLPRAMPKGSLLLNLCNTAPIWLKEQLVVIHDVSTARVPQSYGWAFRTWYGALIPAVYRRSRSVCTVSHFSAQELATLYGHREDVCVLPEGTDHMSRFDSNNEVLIKHNLFERPYALSVSSLSPHKNFAIVIKALASMGNCNFNLVVAGGQNTKVFSDATSDLSAFVKYVGYVSDEELKALYENASCFIFPSIYEGYGLPPTEAMACGCPVLASNSASIPEICGEAALYFDPYDANSLANQITRVLGDQKLRKDLRSRGSKHAASLRWDTAALALINEIHRVSW